MEVFHWPGSGDRVAEASVATLGVFDGVHIGHRAILRRVVGEARKRRITPAVITFDRHPHDVLDAPPEPCITSLEHRLRLFEQLGIGKCLVIRFTRNVARMEAPDFARSVFRDLLGVRLLILGFDARFGRGRAGDVALCRKMSAELGLRAQVVRPVKLAGDIVSSTAIRKAVREADLRRAERLLGRPFSVFGTVVHGAGRGHDLGYPTANLDVHHELLPREGVYATRVCMGGETRNSVTSVGRRETFTSRPRESPVVEVHVLETDLELYEKDIEVQFIRWLRPQERFDSPQALARQIAADVDQARAALRQGCATAGSSSHARSRHTRRTLEKG